MDVLQAFVAGGACTALVTGVFKVIEWLLNRNATKEDRRDAAQEFDYSATKQEIAEIKQSLGILMIADRTIMYSEIKRQGKIHLANKYITVEDLEDLDRMHQVYHDKDKLNGNGFLDGIMDAVHKLPKHAS